jgi:hypothetical protein
MDDWVVGVPRIEVSSQEELQSALRHIVAGQTIILSEGNYEFEQGIPVNVTVTTETRNAKVTYLTMKVYPPPE